MSIRKGATIIAGNSSPLDWTGTLQEYNIALENGTIKENMVCYITDDTLYTDDIRPEIETLNSVKANKDLSNLSEVGEKHFLNKSQITNCITEIPQRIKYDLTDGTLTVKAGSVVIVPYGIEDLTSQYPKGARFLHDNFKVFDTQFADGKFFVWAEVQSDISSDTKETTIYDRFVGLCIGRNEYTRNNNVSSGTGDSTGNWFVHYSTDKNIVMTTNGSGEIIQTQYGNTSLPFLIATGDGVNSYGSINQVFNGIGYIGTVAWVDKDIKCLVPNGRNEDGTLNNIAYTVSNLRLINIPTGSNNLYTTMFYPNDNSMGNHLNRNVYVQDSEPVATEGNTQYWYNPTTNVSYRSKATELVWVEEKSVPIYSFYIENDIVQFFNPKETFRAINYSDKSEVSGWGMPSNKAINLTLGATHTSYLIPANGWIVLQASATSTDSHIAFINGHWYSNIHCSDTGHYFGLNCPVKKSDSLTIDYRNLNVLAFRFIYAEGEV